jgi:short-subunit dehydrogenase
VKRLDGATVVITGAAGAIGSRLAHSLRGRGTTVVGIDRQPCSACDRTIEADLSDPGSIERTAQALQSEPVDLLVNVAGAQYFGPADQQDPASIALTYTVNLVAPATLIAAVLPGMLARGEGQIANIGSVMGTIAYPYFATYSSSKAGLAGLSDALRRELGGRGITVTHIAPRAIATGFNSAAVNRFLELVKMHADAPDQVAQRIARAILDQRRSLSIGVAEGVFARINALAPSLIDRGLAGQVAKASTLFS